MDSMREHPSDFDPPSSTDTAAPQDVSAAIGTDERRMHVRAYNYWAGLLDGRDFPSIGDLESADVTDFSAHSVLLDFTCGVDNPAMPYIGTAIRDECALDDDTRTIADVPSRSLLSRLTDHYMQIIANRAPVGFEAEFENPQGQTICYRGILMPFSSNGEDIDFIYGVINWKRADAHLAAQALVAPLAPELEAPEPEQTPEFEIAGIAAAEPIEPFEDDEEPLELTDMVAPAPQPVIDEPTIELADFAEPVEIAVHSSWEDGPLHDEDEVAVPEIALDATAGLADRLWAARETAESVKAGEGRTRTALYKALSLAYDFAVAAQQNPHEYAELLDESGVKAQARAPMTPIVKLVFGVDYDKARLTEFAAALCHAQRHEIAPGGFQDFIEKQAGGLKALVAAGRQARRPEPRPDHLGDAARARLRSAAPISLSDLPQSEEFAVVVTRRGPDG